MNAQRAIARFDQLADEWLVDLKMWDAEIIQINPDPKTWSLAEVYDHVMKVARTYQIPCLKQSLTDGAIRKRSKNLTGIAIFDLVYRKQVHMRMEEFPTKFIDLFSPIKRTKEDLVEDFSSFIQEVKDLQQPVLESSSANKHFHPMFGDISTKEWYYLIEFHIWQHNKQKEKIINYLRHGELCVAC
ncbi:MAG: hypothetical protein R8G66_11400 [Cytophagales bacterium]|nr:hypothetical protein [Cytophagales bacterium]